MTSQERGRTLSRVATTESVYRLAGGTELTRLRVEASAERDSARRASMIAPYAMPRMVPFTRLAAEPVGA